MQKNQVRSIAGSQEPAEKSEKIQKPAGDKRTCLRPIGIRERSQNPQTKVEV